ncbi:unnamed protein product [Soboliphyme baturini]|uniref:Uncharacterized protein n=1 Tax=Soboliphyme baturini TaxID=241478 RepID=A0A183IDX6_9BILA|nr:unnamed protein product [Soboliphyme baturini]
MRVIDLKVVFRISEGNELVDFKNITWLSPGTVDQCLQSNCGSVNDELVDKTSYAYTHVHALAIVVEWRPGDTPCDDDRPRHRAFDTRRDSRRDRPRRQNSRASAEPYATVGSGQSSRLSEPNRTERPAIGHVIGNGTQQAVVMVDRICSFDFHCATFRPVLFYPVVMAVTGAGSRTAAEPVFSAPLRHMYSLPSATVVVVDVRRVASRCAAPRRAVAVVRSTSSSGGACHLEKLFFISTAFRNACFPIIFGHISSTAEMGRHTCGNKIMNVH